MTESGFKLISWVVAAALITATLAIPQAVDPWELPTLVLDRAAVADAIRFDEALAADAADTEEARALRSLFLEHGRAEAHPPYGVSEYNQRQVAIHRATQALIDAHGPPAFEAMRARAVEEVAQIFFDGDHEPQNDEEVAVLGGFSEVAKSYGLVHRGVVVAPELTVRALYKARWNSIHRQPFVDGFSQVELQAYWGWLALHGWGKPLEKREDALVAFRDAGGFGTQEAAALFDLLAGQPERAATSLQELYAARGELRLRNMGLGALHAALSRGRSP
ncbi:MAG: hypothetical protein JSV06_11600 [Myxococcales bacterium]|nr:MAG: hypothetical protein JSV06_11600 [Myxococcales bacterium]